VSSSPDGFGPEQVGRQNSTCVEDAGTVGWGWDVGLWPTVEHRGPWSRGGSGDEDSLICTTWWRNDSERALSMAETGWEVTEPGDIAAWDALSRCFLAQVHEDVSFLDDQMVASYHRATRPLHPAALRGTAG
jgi:hypothetical protein